MQNGKPVETICGGAIMSAASIVPMSATVLASITGPNSGAICVIITFGRPALRSMRIGIIPAPVSKVIGPPAIFPRCSSDRTVATVGCPANGISPLARKYLTLTSALVECSPKVHSDNDVSRTNLMQISSLRSPASWTTAHPFPAKASLANASTQSV